MNNKFVVILLCLAGYVKFEKLTSDKESDRRDAVLVLYFFCKLWKGVGNVLR